MKIMKSTVILIGFVLPFTANAQTDEGLEQAASASQMSAAATAFVASLDASQHDVAVFDLKDEARPTWSNLPISMVRPSGLLVADMNDGQAAAHCQPT